MLRVLVLRRGMWRTVYAPDAWTFAAHLILALLALCLAVALWR